MANRTSQRRRASAMQAKTQTHSAVASDPVASWHVEADTINASNPTFGARIRTARTLVTRCTASVELSQDSPHLGAQLGGVMNRAMAAAIDGAGTKASGTPPEPTGILHTSGRSSQTNTGALTNYGKIITGIGALLGANCDLAQVIKCAIESPGSLVALEYLVTGIASDRSQLKRPTLIENMQFLTTTNVPGDATSSPQVKTVIHLGDFRDLLLGVRLESPIEC